MPRLSSSDRFGDTGPARRRVDGRPDRPVAYGRPAGTVCARCGSTRSARAPAERRAARRTRPMSELAVGVVREGGAGERRVGLVPESVARLAARGLRTVVQAGAGAGAWLPDAEYAAAGATVAPD